MKAKKRNHLRKNDSDSGISTASSVENCKYPRGVKNPLDQKKDNKRKGKFNEIYQHIRLPRNLKTYINKDSKFKLNPIVNIQTMSTHSSSTSFSTTNTSEESNSNEVLPTKKIYQDGGNIKITFNSLNNNHMNLPKPLNFVYENLTINKSNETIEDENDIREDNETNSNGNDWLDDSSLDSDYSINNKNHVSKIQWKRTLDYTYLHILEVKSDNIIFGGAHLDLSLHSPSSCVGTPSPSPPPSLPMLHSTMFANEPRKDIVSPIVGICNVRSTTPNNLNTCPMSSNLKPPITCARQVSPKLPRSINHGKKHIDNINSASLNNSESINRLNCIPKTLATEFEKPMPSTIEFKKPMPSSIEFKKPMPSTIEFKKPLTSCKYKIISSKKLADIKDLRENIKNLKQAYDDHDDDQLSIYAPSELNRMYDTFNDKEKNNTYEPTFGITQLPSYSQPSYSQPSYSQPSPNITFNKRNISFEDKTIASIDNWVQHTAISNAHDRSLQKSALDTVLSICVNIDRCNLINTCTKRHTIPTDLKTLISNSPSDEIPQIFDYIKSSLVLLSKIFPLICYYYKENGKVENLIGILEDLLCIPDNKTPYVKNVIEAIIGIGDYDFPKAIDEILIQHGRNKYSDILLNIVIEEQDFVEKYWFLIQKLTRYRITVLDHGLIDDIIDNCIKYADFKNNPSIFQNLFQDLLNKEFVNINKINPLLFNELIKKLNEYKLNTLSEYLINHKKNSEMKASNNYTITNPPFDISYSRDTTPNIPTIQQIHSQTTSLTQNYDNLPLHLFSIPPPNMLPPPLARAPKNNTPNEPKYKTQPNMINQKNVNVKKKLPPPLMGLVTRDKRSENIKRDIMKLNTAILKNNASDFITILNNHKQENMVDVFLPVVIDQVIKLKASSLYHMLMLIIPELDNLGNKDPELRNLISNIAFHLMVELYNSKTMHTEHIVFAGKIAMLYYDQLAYFLNTKVRHYSYLNTAFEKTSLIVNVLNKNKFFREALVLMKSNNFPINVPGSYNVAIAKDFLEKTLASPDLSVCRDFMYFFIDTNNTQDIEIWKFFNFYLLKIINQANNYTQQLLLELDYILKYSHNISPGNLRGTIIQLYKVLNKDDILELYNICCIQEIYSLQEGFESTVYLRRNLTRLEIEIVIKMFFLKMAICKNRPRPLNIIVDGYCPNDQCEPAVLTNCNKEDNPRTIQIKICNALASMNPSILCDDSRGDRIDINLEQASRILHSVKTYYNIR